MTLVLFFKKKQYSGKSIKTIQFFTQINVFSLIFLTFVLLYRTISYRITKYIMIIDTTNMCSHLQTKLFEPYGVYYPIWQAIQDDETITAVVRSRQLHIYRNGKKILVLAGKAQPKIIREDKLNELIIK